MIGESNTLEELLAAGAACIAEEWVRAMFEITEFDPDEVHGFMDSKKAAFLGHPYASFKEISVRLPRYDAGAVRVPQQGRKAISMPRIPHR